MPVPQTPSSRVDPDTLEHLDLCDDHAAVRHWALRIADALESELEAAPSPGPVVCASGISPSGPIHMGNLREVMTTHLVVEALGELGLRAVHLHSWDDYDRLRKVPAGVPSHFERFIGMPLAEIPDPWGERQSYADRFIDDFRRATEDLGVRFQPVRQSQRYPSGAYNAAIRRAMGARLEIFDTLASHETPGRNPVPLQERRAKYYPFKPYCERCRRDSTSVTEYADPSVAYTCHDCGHAGTMSLADGCPISGKLFWKVDWPMRWKHEGVRFEPAGEDHHAPTGSFTVGAQLVREVFGGDAPQSTVYSFVSLSGAGGKMSGSRGAVVTPADALRVLEPAVVRWPYVQRSPAQGFAIDISPKGIQRLYDHWDQYATQALEAAPSSEHAAVYHLTTKTSTGPVRRPRRPVSFRLLSSVADLTQANRQQIGRIVSAHVDASATDVLLEELEPRLTCAINYAVELLPADQRTIVRTSFNEDAWQTLDARTRDAIADLAERLPRHWSLDQLTKLVYSVPKTMVGLPPDAAPSPEVKQAQREFFKVLYRMLCSAETGPRLPTLMLSIGLEKTKWLLEGTTRPAAG